MTGPDWRSCACPSGSTSAASSRRSCSIRSWPCRAGSTRDERSRFAGAQGLFTYFDVISLIVITFPYVIVWLWLRQPGGKTAIAWLVGAVGARLLAAGGGAKSAGAASGIIGRLRKLGPGVRNALLGALAVVLVVGGVLLLCVWMLELHPAGDEHVVRFPLLVGLLAAALFVLLGVVLDFNKLSLHYFYRDRLAETYLQTFGTAPSSGRVEVKKRDDSEMPLSELHGRHRDDAHAAVCVTAAPYHLVMTALNLTASRDMTRRDRKSDYFVFSRLYCGSETTGYMRTDTYRSGETKLARAMTISGAAASSAIGSQTFLAQSFALTLLGVRLGQWMENPRYREGARANRNEGGVFWPFYLLREMLGSTDASRRLINVSDGGHTGDNVGICPLLKRRCSVIIACDAEADPQFAFGSLTEALRQIYVDENICVELDLDLLQPDPPRAGASGTGPSARSATRGSSTRPATVVSRRRSVPDRAQVVVRGRSRGLRALKNYLREHPEFPHEGTLDQFFSDDQFESYRELGALVAAAAWKASRRVTPRGQTADVDAWRWSLARSGGGSRGRRGPCSRGRGGRARAGSGSGGGRCTRRARASRRSPRGAARRCPRARRGDRTRWPPPPAGSPPRGRWPPDPGRGGNRARRSARA